MSYFGKFPLYITRVSTGVLGSSAPKQNSQIIMTDFFRRITLGKDLTNVSVGLTPYVISEGETPEGVAYAYYGSAFYHWVILIVNGIVDVRREWPLDLVEFEEFVADKYVNINAVHHYEDSVTGYIMDYDGLNPSLVPVTNYEYETEINEAKRPIRLLDPKYLQTFVSTFDALIKR